MRDTRSVVTWPSHRFKARAKVTNQRRIRKGRRRRLRTRPPRAARPWGTQ